MDTKITKKEFLALVDLASAVHGFHKVRMQGSYEADPKVHATNLDRAIAAYVFFTYRFDGSQRTAAPSLYKYETPMIKDGQTILNHWTEG